MPKLEMFSVLGINHYQLDKNLKSYDGKRDPLIRDLAFFIT
jgi:hypothetical protein